MHIEVVNCSGRPIRIEGVAGMDRPHIDVLDKLDYSVLLDGNCDVWERDVRIRARRVGVLVIKPALIIDIDGKIRRIGCGAVRLEIVKGEVREGANLVLDVSYSDHELKLGDEVEVELTFENLGPGVAQVISVHDLFPPDFMLIEGRGPVRVEQKGASTVVFEPSLELLEGERRSISLLLRAGGAFSRRRLPYRRVLRPQARFVDENGIMRVASAGELAISVAVSVKPCTIALRGDYMTVIIPREVGYGLGLRDEMPGFSLRLGNYILIAPWDRLGLDVEGLDAIKLAFKILRLYEMRRELHRRYAEGELTKEELRRKVEEIERAEREVEKAVKGVGIEGFLAFADVRAEPLAALTTMARGLVEHDIQTDVVEGVKALLRRREELEEELKHLAQCVEDGMLDRRTYERYRGELKETIKIIDETIARLRKLLR